MLALTGLEQFDPSEWASPDVDHLNSSWRSNTLYKNQVLVGAADRFGSEPPTLYITGEHTLHCFDVVTLCIAQVAGTSSIRSVCFATLLELVLLLDIKLVMDITLHNWFVLRNDHQVILEHKKVTEVIASINVKPFKQKSFMDRILRRKVHLVSENCKLCRLELTRFGILEFWDGELRLWVSEPVNHIWSAYNATIGLTDWGRVMIEIIAARILLVYSAPFSTLPTDAAVKEFTWQYLVLSNLYSVPPLPA
eukprot:4357-Heterococcus_DN1.PRE.2